MKLLRKSKWNSDLSQPQIKNWITSFDFSPNGEMVATIDKHEMCSISNVNTNNCVFSFEAGQKKSNLEFSLYMIYRSLYLLKTTLSFIS